jgi:hypothetical protein
VSNLLEEVEGYIEAAGLGWSNAGAGANLFLSSMPEDPDEVCVLSTYPGQASEMGFGKPGVDLEYPGLQVQVRSLPDDYAGGMAKIVAVYRQLCEIQGQVIGGTRYNMIRPQQAPYPLRRDDNRRVIFVVNFIVEKELSA